MATTLHELLSIVVEREASDLHLSCQTSPQIRIDGTLEALEQFERLASSDVQRLIYSVLTEPQRQRFEAGHDLDFSIDVEELARFRCNVYRHFILDIR